MNQEIEIIKAIHDYARGNLTEAEADQLWMMFLEKPEYLDWLIMEVTMLHIASKN